MQENPLDRLLAPQSQDNADPLAAQIRNQERQRALAAVSRPSVPDRAAQAARLADQEGLPADTVERNLPTFQDRDRARRWASALDRTPMLAGWLADPRNAAVAGDDYDGLSGVGSALGGFARRRTDLVAEATDIAAANQALPDRLRRSLGREGLLQVASRLRARARDVRYEGSRAGSLTRTILNTDLLRASGLQGSDEERVADSQQDDGTLDRLGALLDRGTEVTRGGLSRLASVLAPFAAARQVNQEASRRAEALGNLSVAGERTWEDVKAAPSVGSVLQFVLDQGTASLPGMALAALPGGGAAVYGASLAGQIGQTRAGNNDRTNADLGDIIAAAPAAAASAFLERAGIQSILGAQGRNVATRVGKAAAGEALTEFQQSAVEYAGGALGTRRGATLAEGFDQALAGAVAGAGMGGGLRAAGEVSTPAARRLVRSVAAAADAQQDAAELDGIAAAAAKSRTRGRDPDAFAALLKTLGGASVDNVHVPAEALASYFQSDPEYDQEFWAPYADQFAEAYATGGDVVIPAEQAVAHLSGTKAWDALRDDFRLTPGGMSLREAATFEDAMADEIARAEQAIEADRAAAEPRQRLFDSIATKLANAGYTPETARTQAELVTARIATRAARLGQELTGAEFDAIDVRQVLPDALRPIVAADSLDLAISAMRRARGTARPAGPSLLEWISKRGGILDPGGDVASMGGDRWHREKAFRKRLIREGEDARQTSILGPGQVAANSADTMLRDAIDAGYFPDLVGREDALDPNILLDAIESELRGTPRHVEMPVDDPTRAAAEQLAMILDQEGLDPDRASDADIRGVVRRYQQEAELGRSYDQFAGLQALDAPVHDLGRAIRMERDGADKALIERETGWRRGADGEWRWEFDDSAASFKDLSGIQVGDTLPLGELIEHPELFENYPMLAAVPVTFTEGAGGGFGGGAMTIGIKNLSRAATREGLGVVLHEVQHAIQIVEGFATGASPKPEALRRMGYGDALDAETARLRAGFQQLEDTGWGSAGGLEDADIEPTAARNIYQRSAGEIEARNTQSRRNMTLAERREDSALWTQDRQDEVAIVRFDPSEARTLEQSPAWQAWSRSVDRIVRGEKAGRFVRLGKVSPALRQAGLAAADLYMTSGKLARVRREHPEISLGTLRALPQLLAAPAAVFPSDHNDGSVIVVVDAQDTDGNPVIVPVTTSPEGSNVVLSVYGKIGGAAWINTRLERAKQRGAAYYEREDFAGAEPKSDPAPEGATSSSPAPIAAEGPAKPARKILSLRAPGNRTLDQSFESGTRGRVTFTPDSTIIQLFEKRDLSTFIHETGHVWLEELREDAAREDAPQQLRDDWQTVSAWFAANGHPLDEDGTIPVAAHELWARGVERFTMEGKAPSAGLRSAFEAFRSWLLSIYRAVENLRSPVSPEIRDVMARLIATDEEIAAATEEQKLRALFTDAAQAGMTEAEFAAYQQAAQEARSEAFDALLFRTMESVRRQRTAEYKERRARLRAEIQVDVDARPVWRAMAMLRDRNSAARLDRQWILDTYGPDALDLIPKNVPPLYAEGGMDADQLAELAGFRTGDEMVRTLMGVEARRKQMREAGDKRSVRESVIDDETDAILRDRYGDPLADGSIEEEARNLIHNDRQGEVIASELRALARQRRRSSDPNQAPTPYAIARRWAAEKVAGGTVREYTSRGAIDRFRRAARQAGEAAEKAILAGDVDETYRQKQRQLLNSALVAEATKAAEAVDAAVGRLSKVARRRTAATIDQDYLEQAQALLEAVDLRQRSQISIERQGKFEAWARAQEADGHEVVVPASFEATLGTTNWTQLSVEQLLGLDETVSQILHLGRLKQTLLDNQERREFGAIVQDAVDAAEALPQRPASNLMEPTWGDRFKAGVANANAALLKMETVFDWLDGGNSNGVFNRVVFQPLARAQDRENAMVADYLGRIRDAFSKLPPEIARRMGERVEVTEFLNRETGQPFVLTRQQLVAAALNMGNEGNIQRLTDGYGWPEYLVRDVLNRELSAPEWQFVQEVWDIVDTLWPEIAAMERRVNGVAPEKVEATPVETPHGTFRGGYYPAVYDSTRSYRAEQHSGEASDLLEGSYTRATTRASSTKDRIEKVNRPLLLQLGVINRHLGEVIHDLTHREAVINAWKFLGNERVMKAVDQSLGPAVRQSFKPWLRFVANSWAQERAGNEGIGKLVNGLRSNATIVGMGFRVSTIVMQLAGYSNSFEYVGARWVAPAIAQVAANPVRAFRFVMERSGEVRSRMDTLDRDIRVSLDAMQGKRGGIWDAKRFMFHGIGYMDRVVVMPTWLGAYNKALAEGMQEQEAIYAADKAVRSSQGASAPKDMAAIQRGTGKWGEALKLFTMFYSYLSAFHQRQMTLGRDISAAGRAGPREALRMTPQLAARAWWLIAVPPILSELLAGRGPDDEEDWGWWAFRKMLFQMLGPIPLVRDLGEPVWAKATGKPSFGYSISPLQRVGETFVNVAGDVGKIAEGKDTKRATRNALEATGYATGLVPGQLASATQFLVDVGAGEQDPEGVKEWWEGLTTGRVKKE